jgi:hypothetical protein
MNSTQASISKNPSKSTFEVFLVLILLTWALTFTLPYHYTTLPPTPIVTKENSTPKQPSLIIAGIPVNSSSDALIDYFVDGVWNEEQETIFENIDKSFTPYTINSEPITTSSF